MAKKKDRAKAGYDIVVSKPTTKGAASKLIDEALYPSANNFGKEIIPASEHLAKSVNIVAESIHQLIMPISEAVGCVGLSVGIFTAKLKAKLLSIPPEEITQANTRVSGPVSEALRHCIDDTEISNMFANLIANSMDKRSRHISHPSFTSIIQQITPDEAKIIKTFQVHVSYPVLDIGATIPDNSPELKLGRRARG